MAHLVPKEIIELPFVDRLPNPSERPDQRRIEWIRNGDCLGAAEHAADNGGELNRGPVQVQKNAVTLVENDRIITESLVEIITRVNSHDDTLGAIGDDNLAQKVADLTAKVDPMEEKITENAQSVFLVGELAKSTRDVVGVKNQVDVNDRTIFNDLLWIKQEIGNWANKDVNDNDNTQIADPSGLKARLVSHGLSISANERRITDLESDWVQSDVGALTSAVQDIRLELGRVVDAPVGGVYPWIKQATTKQDENALEIANLKNIVGGHGGQTLDERITQNTVDINSAKTDIIANANQIDNIKAVIGDSTQQMSLTYKVNANEMNIAELTNVVGSDENAGLRKSVGDIMNEMGNDTTAGTLKGRLATVETNIREDKRDIALINTKIGDNTIGAETGIYRRITLLEADVSSPTTGIKDRLDGLDGLIAEKVEEAPKDGKTYARQDGAWVESLGGGGTVAEAPDDGKSYVRKNQDWVDMTEDGLTIPNGESLKYNDGNKDIDLLGVIGTKTYVGGSGNTLKIADKVESFSVVNNFELSCERGRLVKATDTDIELGSSGVQTVISSTAGAPLVVNTGANRHEVLHKGNFADVQSATVPHVRVNDEWKPLSDYAEQPAHGGMYVIGNTSETDLVADTDTDMMFDASASHDFAFNQDVVRSGSGIKFTGNTGTVCILTARFSAKIDTPADVTFKLFRGTDDTGIEYTVKADQWSSDKTAYAYIQYPASMVTDAEFSVKISSTDAAKVVVDSGTMYVYQI